MIEGGCREPGERMSWKIAESSVKRLSPKYTGHSLKAHLLCEDATDLLAEPLATPTAGGGEDKQRRIEKCDLLGHTGVLG